MEEQRESAPHNKLHGVESVRWTEGFWAEKFDLCRDTILPSMRKALEHPENTAAFVNFYIAAGLEEGEHQGTHWSDGDCYKWMEAMAQVYAITREEENTRQLDELIGVIARAQEENGYICTQIQLSDLKPWSDKYHHELYNFGHLLTAACTHHRVTDKENFLDIACKAGDHLYDTFSGKPRALGHFGWNPSNIMGLVELYRVTGEKRYLELAGIFVDMRGSVSWREDEKGRNDIGDQNQDREPLRQEDGAVGHAVTATYLYAGATDLCAETGEEALLSTLERIWKDVAERKIYITGGIGPHHQGISVRGDQVHEAFAAPYELPNGSAYNETCANIGLAMWCWRMLNLTGQSKYTEMMEQVVYNSGLSGMSIDGCHFRYTNPLRWHGEDQRLLSNDTLERWYVHNCYCCPPQVARTIARMHRWAYGISEEGLWIHLYGGSRLETTIGDQRLGLLQQTRYPWEGKVDLIFEKAPDRSFAVRLHIPTWATGATVEVNGQQLAEASVPGSYLSIERKWRDGDEIRLYLPMAVQLMEAHPRVEEARNQVAVVRGPLVYCLESADLPDGVSVSEIRVPRQIELEPRYEKGLLGGVMVLEGDLCRSGKEWKGGLYRPQELEDMESVRTRLVPYFAWNNRGIGEMSVWLPRD